MQSSVSPRIFGRIEELKSTYGFVRGDDGRQYFFLPSFVLSPNDFIDLIPGQRCCFLVQAHPRGLRATGIVLVESAEDGDAETHSQPADR